jgi:ABC-2 type transport system permease protein
MNSLLDMMWIETRKAIRSLMPVLTAVGALLMPLGIAFLIFVARNPELSKQLGLVSAKANLVAYSATDWPAYLGLTDLIVAAGGFLLFILVISWVFGREFADRTLKDLLAVPVQRSRILLAKFVVVAAWSLALALLILAASLVMGALIGLPGGSLSVLAQGSARMLATTALVIAVTMPFAIFASVGRGYLLPLGVALLMSLAANVLALAGWGEFFPWAVPGLYAQATDPLTSISYLIVLLTGLAGIIGTYLWWMNADQSR